MKVLRSISLPSDLDEVLRVLSFHLKVPREELTIALLTRGAEAHRDLLNKYAPGLLPRHMNRKRQEREKSTDSSLVYRYFLLPHLEKSLNKYVEFDVSHDITVWNVYYEDGDYCSLQGQDGSTELAIHELMEIGRICELHKQVMAKKLDYDPHILWSKDHKKWYLP